MFASAVPAAWSLGFFPFISLSVPLSLLPSFFVLGHPPPLFSLYGCRHVTMAVPLTALRPETARTVTGRSWVRIPTLQRSSKISTEGLRQQGLHKANYSSDDLQISSSENSGNSL